MNPRNAAPARALHAQPVRGAREPLCKTDEASVSRMLSPKRFSGMVERLQGTAASDFGDEMMFSLSHARYPEDNARMVSLDCPENFILRFLALRFARSVHLENFINPKELRISRTESGLVSAMYSDFVPDENGVVARRAVSARRYYASADDAQREDVKKQADAAEHGANPALANCMSLMELSGIAIPHPEANYHLANGKTVFFEVLGINVPRAFRAAVEFAPDREESIALLSMMCSLAIQHYIRIRPDAAAALGREFGLLDFEGTSAVARSIFSEFVRHPVLLGEMGDAAFFRDFSSSLRYIYDAADFMRHEGASVPHDYRWPVEIDAALLRPLPVTPSR